MTDISERCERTIEELQQIEDIDDKYQLLREELKLVHTTDIVTYLDKLNSEELSKVEGIVNQYENSKSICMFLGLNPDGPSITKLKLAAYFMMKSRDY